MSRQPDFDPELRHVLDAIGRWAMAEGFEAEQLRALFGGLQGGLYQLRRPAPATAVATHAELVEKVARWLNFCGLPAAEAERVLNSGVSFSQNVRDGLGRVPRHAAPAASPYVVRTYVREWPAGVQTIVSEINDPDAVCASVDEHGVFPAQPAANGAAVAEVDDGGHAAHGGDVGFESRVRGDVQ